MTDTMSCQVDDASSPDEFNSLIEKIALWAASNHFWQIKSLVKSNDGFTLLVGPNILNHDLQDTFDDVSGHTILGHSTLPPFFILSGRGGKPCCPSASDRQGASPHP